MHGKLFCGFGLPWEGELAINGAFTRESGELWISQSLRRAGGGGGRGGATVYMPSFSLVPLNADLELER